MSSLDDFPELLSTCAEVASVAPEGIVFIGGIAVYLHAINHEPARHLAEATHDGDFYISMADMGDLRDLEEVTPNRRLSKHQLIKNGFEFDIYTERQSKLIVPYDHVAAHSVVYDGVRVASLGDLLALKVEAYRDRRSSAKGMKDAKDLLRLAAIAADCPGAFDAQAAAAFLSDDHIDLLKEVARSPAAMELARGNAVAAKKIRSSFNAISQVITDAGKSVAPSRPRPRG